MKAQSILVIDDSLVDLEIISIVCHALGCEVDVAKDGFEALRLYERKRHTVVLADYKMEPMNGIYLTARIKEMDPNASCLIVSGFPDQMLRTFVANHDMPEIVTKPICMSQLIETLKFALRRSNEVGGHINPIAFSNRMDECPALLGESSVIRNVRERLVECVSARGALLLKGPNGVGKRDIARMLHTCGFGGKNELVEFACAMADVDNSFESLFGPEEEWGPLLERARYGTLLLTDVEALSPVHQATFVRHFKDIEEFVWVISLSELALDRNLGKVGMDPEFYFEIAMETIDIPPLAERPEDVRSIIRFVAASPIQFGLTRVLSDEEICAIAEKLILYDYPDNVAGLIRRVRQLVEPECRCDRREA